MIIKKALLCGLLFCLFYNGFAQKHLCKHQLQNSLTTMPINAFRETSASSSNWDVKYYRCKWDITPNVRYISGNVTMLFKMLANSNTVTFDLLSSLVVDSIKYHNALLSFTRPIDAVAVNFPASIANNVLDSITVFYQGAPPTTEGYFATGTHAGAPITYTISQPYGAKYWWPCKDNLIDKADSIDIYINHPNTQVASSNGKLISQSPNGSNTISFFKHKYPIVSYLVALAVSNYNVQNRTLTSNGNSMVFKNYVYPESINAYNNNIAKIELSFADFEQKFGPYPFNNEQYTQTQIANGIGGMEHQTNSFIDSYDEDLMAHELAHQWFGDMATCGSWQHIWLNEGYATFGEILHTEKVYGIPTRTFQMQGIAADITAFTTGSVFRTDTTVNSIFNYRLSYQKGAYALHMLRWVLGDNKFFNASKNYLQAPGIKYGFARTDSLKKYMELEYGSSLNTFFNNWIYGQGYPTYTVKWNQNAGNHLAVSIAQTTSNATVPFYNMPVPVQFIGVGRDTTIVFNHTSSGQIFNTPLPFTVTAVNFDPLRWILSKNNTVQFDNTLTITGLNNIVNETKITVGPSPAKNEIFIYNSSNRTIKTIEIVDIKGTVVLNRNFTSNINIQHLAAGIYILKLKDTAGKLIVKKFVKQ